MSISRHTSHRVHPAPRLLPRPTLPASKPSAFPKRAISRKANMNWWHRYRLAIQPTWLLAAIAFIALTTSGYLAFVASTSSKVIGCSGGLFNCDHVLTSHWSQWFGLPVSYLAVGLYAGVLTCLALTAVVQSPKVLSSLRWAVNVFALSAGLVAIWFVGLQVFAVKSLCWYCLLAHACGLALAITVIASRKREWQKPIRQFAMAIVGLLFLITGQLFGTPAPQFQLERHATPTLQAPADVFAPPQEDQAGETPTVLPPEDDYTPDLTVRRTEAQSRATMLFGWSSSLVKGVRLAGQLPQGTVTLRRRPLKPAAVSVPSNNDSAQDAEPTSTGQPNNNSARDEERQLARFANSNGGITSLDPKHWPLIGSPDAKFVCVEMFDYTCSHCRNTQPAIDVAFQQLGSDLALIVIPVPLNTHCNPAVQQTSDAQVDACDIAAIAIAVWRIDSKKFTEFHKWILAGQSAPTKAAVRHQAEALVGKENLATELSKPQVGQFIEKHVQLYQLAGAGIVPKILFPSSTLTGEITSGQELIRIIESEMKK